MLSLGPPFIVASREDNQHTHHTLQLVAAKVNQLVRSTTSNIAFETTILLTLVPILLRKPLVLSAVKADYFLYLIICQVKSRISTDFYLMDPQLHLSNQVGDTKSEPHTIFLYMKIGLTTREYILMSHHSCSPKLPIYPRPGNCSTRDDSSDMLF